MTGASEERRPVVRVGCRHANGLMLRLFKPGPVEGMQLQDGPGFRLNGPTSGVAAGVDSPTGAEGGQFGITELEPEFWNKWVAQNKGHNPHLDDGFVFLLDENGQPAENPT